MRSPARTKVELTDLEHCLTLDLGAIPLSLDASIRFSQVSRWDFSAMDDGKRHEYA
jgi:hypothetical protein